jgi:3',5'-cyclic AMP phosphodiesterase CpdA
MILDRRQFLKTAVVAGAASAIGAPATFSWPAPETNAGSFDFIFFTDTHIEPELDAAHGCDMCFRKIAGITSDFAVMGGDHVYDALGVDGKRADEVYGLYKKTEQTLRMPIHHTIGNHDAFGILTKSGVAPSDPAYGKKMFEDRIGRTYYSFDHKGYHFVLLDSIQPTEDRSWEARVDETQLRWLAEDLKGAGANTPVIGITHVPLVTAFATYAEKPPVESKYNQLSVANVREVLSAFSGHNVVAVLQGHTHVNELVEHQNTKFITGGAVCGNWWHGPRMGFPEGFTVVSLREGKISSRYETYGFKSVDPREKF